MTARVFHVFLLVPLRNSFDAPANVPGNFNPLPHIFHLPIIRFVFGVWAFRFPSPFSQLYLFSAIPQNGQILFNGRESRHFRFILSLV